MRKPVTHREATGHPTQPAQPPPEAAADEAAPEAAAAPSVSFARDIAPMFAPFAAAMMWRFDLGDYWAVMANAQTIYGRISSAGNPMPPPPFPMLTAAQIQTFQDWMTDGCKP